MIARTVETFRFADDDYDAACARAVQLAKELGAVKFVLGLPKHMNGDVGIRGQISLDFKAKLEAACGRLSEVRREYSHQLEEKVIQGLKDLNFLDVQFAITFARRSSFTDNGFDEIQYEISTNPGETLKPLGKIVSGGELSRIMLALKAILADRDQIETLIFDEIDTGISGRTAQKVSEKMAVIGHHHQVLCITHLPQIAAMADSHFEIEKQVEGTKTTTQIHTLDQESSIRELARLLGGAQITDAVLENAREMKKLAGECKAGL